MKRKDNFTTFDPRLYSVNESQLAHGNTHGNTDSRGPVIFLSPEWGERGGGGVEDFCRDNREFKCPHP